ncbi:unnamed protein product [Rhizoctonia solani]|uniref:Uncharacterized protein n=1 Tax=Rhizoctonia solani TaxID=456999 RepID=A0A8H2WAW5_9AGAM|nr:unnamed protein product [Rhizoctonia solani]
MDVDMHIGISTDNETPMETGQANGESAAMNAPEAPTSDGQSNIPLASEPSIPMSAVVNGFTSQIPMSFSDQMVPLSSDSLVPSDNNPLPYLFPNTVPVDSIPTRRTQWMPDFTFGPASEPIDIPAFLSGVQEALGMEQNLQQTGGGLRNWVRPEHVAGWSELQALGLEEIKMLQEAYITSDPARLDLVKEIHNQSTLAALGHTTESIKLPPEKRDRKRKVSGKTGVMGGDDPGNEAPRGQRDDGTSGGAQEEGSWGLGDEIGVLNTDVRGVAGGANAGVSPSTMASEATPGPAPAPITAYSRGGRSRKGKARADAGETVSDPALLELGDMLGGLKLHSWRLTDAAKHYIRKPRSSDVNVLTEVRPSAIPFVLPESLVDGRREHSSPSDMSLQGPATQRSAHALIELSILTPAPHPPHTPRHTLSLALLNSQTLEDISEALICANRWIPRSINDSGVPSGACIVIEGTVYGDGEGDGDGKDYADKVTEYLAALKAQANTPTGLGKKERDAIMILDEQLKIGMPMLNTRLDSIRWKLHKPYWFMHDGGCVHWIVVSSISVLHPHDPQLPTPEKSSNWPYTTALSPLPHRALCRVCSRVPAVLAVSGDSRLVLTLCLDTGTMSPSETTPPRLPRIQQLGFSHDVSTHGNLHHPSSHPWHGPNWSQSHLDHSQAAVCAPEHVITVYMEDMRDNSQSVEPTMAEIPMSVRIDPASNAWCIAGNDLAVRLQQTPSRIDGDAKLCTMRGRYKHCFARIASSEVERYWIPVELKLAQDKSLEITIEPNPAPSTRPPSLPPAERLLELGKRGTETRPGHQSLPIAKRSITNSAPSSPPTQSTTPPPTPGPSRAGDIHGWRMSDFSQSSASTSSCASPQIQAEPPQAHVNIMAKSKSTKPKESKPEVNAAIIGWLRHQFNVQDPQSYNSFLQSKGKSLPIEDLLRGYRYVANLIAQYNDTRTPSGLKGAPDRKISKANIFAALGRQTSWGSDTETTLALYELYGPGKEREDPRIVAIMNGKCSGSKEGSVGFLHTLKEVDREFSSKHSGGPNQYSRRPSDASSSR